MRRIPLIALWVLVGAALASEPTGKPLSPEEVKAGRFFLKAGRLVAEVMVPDVAAAPYAGQRFETGGVVLQVTLDGKHTFLGREPRGARLGGIGLIEEMGISRAIGYGEARPGEPFLKLGVGLLARGRKPRYLFYPPYREIERFRWKVSRTQTSATFLQVGKPFKGYAYRYHKRLVLDPKKPHLRIEHELTNTGEKPIETDQYCHNFFCFDGRPPSPDYLITTAFPLVPERSPSELMKVEGRSITFVEKLRGAAYSRFRGQGEGAKSHAFRVENRATGLAVEVGGDFPVSAFALYADAEAVSPEAFVALKLEPKKTIRWTRTYAFEAIRQHR